MYEPREQQWIEDEYEEGNVLKCQYSHREWELSYMYRIRWDLSLRLSISALVYMYVRRKMCMVAAREDGEWGKWKIQGLQGLDLP